MFVKSSEMLQFGCFTVDPVRRCLLRNGEAVFLPAKAFDILLFMLENPGRVLTRDEILKTIWPDTVVEEGNLSQNIFLIRKALGESANEQRYVLTVFGSGYQFAGSIERRPQSASRVEGFPAADPNKQPETERTGPRLIASGNSAVLSAVPAQRPEVESKPALVMPVPRAGRKRLPIAIACLLLAAAAAGVAAWAHWRTIPPGNIHVLLVALDNSTGDPTFDHALSRALQIELQQSPSLVIYSEARVQRTLRQMQLAPTDKPTVEDYRQACQRLNGQAMLEPLIASFGGHYLLTLSAKSCVDGHLLGDRKQVATDKAGVLAALDKLADGIRRDIGESRASILRYDVPLMEGETSSLDALKAYSEGARLANQGKERDAIAMDLRAIELDPKFAIAYADISSMYYDLGDHEQDKEFITKAYQLRNTVNDRYRYYIEYRYHMSVTGDLRQSIAALEQDSTVYPHDGAVSANLCNLENWIGKYAEAVRYADRTMEIDHSEGIYNAIAFEIAARAYKHANQFDRALQVGAEAAAKGANAGMLGLLVQIAGIQQKPADMEHWIAVSRGTTSEAHVLQQAGAAALYAGQVKKSLDLFQQAHLAAKRDGSEADLIDLDATEARMLAEVGLNDQAVAAINALPKMDEAMDAVYAMAKVGDPAKALRIAQQRTRENATDQLLNVEFAPAVQAALAMRSGHPEKVPDLMAADTPFMMRDPTVPYLLGQAYLAAGKPEQAIPQFQRFLDNPGIDDPLTPLYALSWLQTGRSQVALGQKQAAKVSYQKFFDLWRYADPDVPVLMQARAEFTRL